ncbi:cation transporter [Rhizobium sp. SEMIA 4085]|uniref:Nitrogen fixation protein FixH 2 n=1 Tax=Rhizobium gallicum bv. gallicum R602sp TaxID=1041138 RepID=A0A0B4XDP4_9HYPH|nr:MULTISPECIES: FixH family protein [Rhizobium]AJD46104.1 nitrogen fixation protein FixH 2 [Rhizobium gallicum bv. gallicum R602sp]NNH32178.1 cation transporter [Rhizobium sp. SEMIA 4085]
MSEHQITNGKGFTGRHMLFIMLSFFGIIISVNMTMAWYASSSWSGLVVKNAYVASQEFNKKAQAMRAMATSGVSGEFALQDGLIVYGLRDRGGSPAAADEVTAHFRRPVGDQEDFVIRLRKRPDGHFEARHRVLSGDWIVEVISKNEGVTVMHEALRINTAGFVQ